LRFGTSGTDRHPHPNPLPSREREYFSLEIRHLACCGTIADRELHTSPLEGEVERSSGEGFLASSSRRPHAGRLDDGAD
jgi:hypothetical protein